MAILTRVFLIAVCVVGVVASKADDPPRYSDWSAPINLGPPVNSSDGEAEAFLSKDGRSLFFASRPRTAASPRQGEGGWDIFVSQRATVEDPWGEPQNLGPTINTDADEQTPALSLDGHLLFFARKGPNGFDLYVSRRINKRDDLGWRTPVNLGSVVNSPGTDWGPAVFDDDETGTFTLYFSSDRESPGVEHIYASTLQEDETFGPPVPVEELNSQFRDVRPFIWKDGLEMLLDSDRDTPGSVDLYVATRASTTEPWSTPVNLGLNINSPLVDARPVLSFDGTELYFHSNRLGSSRGNDLYVSTRTKLKGPDKDEK
jgi:hypothetical protein